MPKQPKRERVSMAELSLRLQAGAPLNLAEASAYLGAHPKTVLRWIADNGLPAHRVPGGREYRFFPSELDGWLRSEKPSKRTARKTKTKARPKR